jgi:hypothetical protein
MTNVNQIIKAWVSWGESKKNSEAYTLDGLKLYIFSKNNDIDLVGYETSHTSSWPS